MTVADPGDPGEARARIDDVWRTDWGRLVALLVAQYRRLDLAEDGLADAFESAARHWPRTGIPDNPPAWLLTAARRRILDRLRSDAVLARRMPLLGVEAELSEQAGSVMALSGEEIIDERLRLVLLCAHPSLAPESAAALTLRLVLGVATADIARLFLVSTSTMAARLTRARHRIAGERFARTGSHRAGGPHRRSRRDRLPRLHRGVCPGQRQRCAPAGCRRGSDPAGPGAARGRAGSRRPGCPARPDAAPARAPRRPGQ